MPIHTVLGISIGLAMDAFAVAVGCSIGLRKVLPGQVFRFAFHFGLFQAVMPIIGWFLGRYTREWIQAWDHWVAFVLLFGIGAKAIYEGIMTEKHPDQPAHDPTRGWSLIMFSVATSLDAFAVGVSLAMVEVAIWTPALVIGLVTSLLTTVGMLAGPRVGVLWEERSEIFGGVILIGIGLKILLNGL